MNRRQFLGRFFQAIISAHNSNSTYGIYHPWRQYEELRVSVRIYLVFRTGTDSSGNSIYSNIPYTGNEGPIMAIYDSNNTMIYCSAYYVNNGTYLYNTIRSDFKVNLLPGTYTIKCLSLGKGLYLGESGQSMSFTVPSAGSRYVDPSTGGYNKYNNYGNISTPSITVRYLFDYEGLTFEYECKPVSVGRDLRNIPGVKKYTYTYPSYEDTLAIAAEYGLTKETWTFNKYLTNCRYYTNRYIPYEESLRLHDIYNEEHWVHAYIHKGLESVEYRGSVNITNAYSRAGIGWEKGLIAVAFEQAFEEQSLPFDPIVDMEPIDTTYDGNTRYPDHLYLGDTREGDTAELLYYSFLDPRYSLNLRLHRPTIGAVLAYDDVRSSISNYDDNIRYITSSSSRDKVEAHVNTKKIHTTTYVDILRFRCSSVQRVLKRTPTRYDGLYGTPPTTESVKDAVNYRINAAVNYNMPKAKSDYDKMLEDWDSYTVLKTSSSDAWSIFIPIDLILGRRKGVLPYKFSCAETGNKDVKIHTTHYGDGSLEELYIIPDIEAAWGRQTEIVAEPLIKDNTIDLTGYEYGYDKSTGWYNNLILRQEIVHLDLSDVPDHQVQPN